MNVISKVYVLVLLSILLSMGQYAMAQDEGGPIRSFTIEGGPIATKHFQFTDENFRERHGITIAKLHTKEYGNWGAYFLNPNSVDDTSFGFGYVTDPYVMALGNFDLELSGALGVVTGYQDYPVPLVAGEARLVLYEQEGWDIGAAMAALPYYVEDNVTGDKDVGVVATTPFLSVRYNFE